MFILCFYGKSSINQRFSPRSSWDFYGAQSWHKGDVAKAEPLISWANRTGVTTMTLGPGKPWGSLGDVLGICHDIWDHKGCKWGYVMGMFHGDILNLRWEKLGDVR